MLVLPIVMIIFSLVIQINSENDDFSFDFNFDSSRFEELMLNPYRELGVAPWSSNKAIKDKYNELVKNYHPDRNKSLSAKEKFHRIQEAYELITKEYKSELDRTFANIILSAVVTIIQICVVLFAVYGCIWVCYKIIDMFIRFIVCFITIALVFERLIPHFFSTFQLQLICCFILTVVITYATGKISPKKNNDKTKSE